MEATIHKQWKSFRITTLLYLIVILLGVNFYFIQTAFETMKQNTTVMNKIGWIEGITENGTPQASKEIIKTLQDISSWAMQQDSSGFDSLYTDLSEETNQLVLCFDKGDSNCKLNIDNLTYISENITSLNRQKHINMTYIVLALTMLLILYLIYFIRLYIRRQLHKHAIHDHESGLYNKKYFDAQLHSACASAQRYKDPLSILHVSLKEDTEKTYGKKTNAVLMRHIGEIFSSVIRHSDIAARYGNSHFVVLMPHATQQNGEILEKRLNEALLNYDFNIEPKIAFDFTVTQYNTEESSETFMQRTLETI